MELTAELKVFVSSDFAVVDAVATQKIANALPAVRASVKAGRTLPRVFCANCKSPIMD